MKSNEFMTEGTEIFAADGNVFAKRSSRGRGKPPAIRMLITKDEWEDIKGQRANTETHAYDIATAEMIIKDMVSKGAEVIWKTAADFNKDARELQNHRFRNDPEVAGHFDTSISQAQDKAKATTKSNLRTVEEEKFPAVKTYTPSEIARKHGVPLSQITKQLRKGIKVEMEHTKDHEVSMEIALDHLLEFPDYYDRLEKAER